MHDLSDPTGVISQLSNTPFASASATLLVGGNTNYIFRLVLLAPYKGRSTLALKHAKPYIASAKNWPIDVSRQIWEVEALARVKAWLPEDSLVTVPTVHLFDKELNYIIMDDAGEGSVTLKSFMIENEVPDVLAKEIGMALGEFIAKMHAWGKAKADTNDDILGFFDPYLWARTISGLVTYGRLISTLTGADNVKALSDPPIKISDGDLEVIAKVAVDRKQAMLDSLETFTMGDFWPGNILITATPAPDGRSPPSLIRLNVVDWEIARPGLPGFDVGQFCAEMYLLSRFYPTRKEASAVVISNFLTSYRHVSGSDVGLARVAAAHVGAHFVAWCPRTPWGSKEETRLTVEEGVRYLVEAYQGPESWMRKSLLSPLL